MLTSSDDKQKEVFSSVRRGFRDLFVYFQDHSNNLQDISIKYLAFISDNIDYSKKGNDFSYIKELFSNNHQREVLNFINELINFRQHYLCRYSPQKNELPIKNYFSFIKFYKSYLEYYNQEIPSSKWEALIKKVTDLTPQRLENLMTKENLSLLAITFMHGTNSAILPSLLETDKQLMSSGRLARANLVPFCGELGAGSVPIGTNQYRISGTSLNDGKRALTYAVNNQFHVKESKEVATITEFIDYYEKEITIRAKEGKALYVQAYPDCLSCKALDPLPIAIARLRILNPIEFKNFEIRLEKILNKMEKDFSNYELSGDYKKNMPKQMDPNGNLGYEYQDYLYFEHFKNIREGIQEAKKKLKEDLIIPKGVVEASQKPYGLIFASKTLHPLTADKSERSAIKAARLGKDIQLIFVSDENKAHLSSYLKEQKLDQSVEIVDMNRLSDAILLNELASPYLASFASPKKVKAQ